MSTASLQPGVYHAYAVNIDYEIKKKTKRRPCSENPDYTVAKCFESYVRKTVGCSSPWDISTDSNVSIDPLGRSTIMQKVITFFTHV